MHNYVYPFGAETLGNSKPYDARYYTLGYLTKTKVEKIVEKVNSTTKEQVFVSKYGTKLYTLKAITEKEVWDIAKRYSAGCNAKDITEYIVCNREKEYKTEVGRYAENAIKFPKSRVVEIIKMIG